MRVPPNRAPAIMRDERHLCAAGDEGGGHDRHTAVTFIFNGTRSHDAGDAAAGADKHRDEGLAGQAELAEDTVQNEGDTGHVAARFEEGQHAGTERASAARSREPRRHRRRCRRGSGRAASRAATGSFQRIADQNRNAGDPNAVVGGIGLVKAVLLKVADSVDIGHADRVSSSASSGIVIVDRHIIDGEGLFVFDLDGRCFQSRRSRPSSQPEPRRRRSLRLRCQAHSSR